jgi:hypothetical protein
MAKRSVFNGIIVVHADRARLCLCNAATSGPLFIPQMIYGYVEPWWHWQGNIEEHGGKNLSQCHFVHHKSHTEVTWAWTRASAVREQRPTFWASDINRPALHMYSICSYFCHSVFWHYTNVYISAKWHFRNQHRLSASMSSLKRVNPLRVW